MKTQVVLLAGILTAILFWSNRAGAIAFTGSANYSTSLAIPDNNSLGVADTENFTLTGATSISSLQVTLDIAGGWNGDYYAYLRHGSSGFAVLLNRVGVTGSGQFGYGDSGFNVTFSDNAANGDIHSYQNVASFGGGTVTGAWQPDGRNVDPSLITGLTPRTAMLSSFTAMDPNGAWTLFVSDNSPVGIGTLDGWGLSVTADGSGTSVPDQGNTFKLLLLSTFVLFLGGWGVRLKQANQY
jgi:subtilisin-like proprotein convertase family protein